MLFAALAVGTLLPAAAAQALDLTVVVTGARSAKGQVVAAVYDKSEGWTKTMLRGEAVAAGERVTLVFRQLPTGTYAVAVYHDENGNGRLDTNVIGVPSEPYGFSRDAAGTLGPPKFADAAVALQADTTINVKLQ
jgi:uncharacterized protein (DUF2141 family)